MRKVSCQTGGYLDSQVENKVDRIEGKKSRQVIYLGCLQGTKTIAWINQRNSVEDVDFDKW